MEPLGEFLKTSSHVRNYSRNSCREDFQECLKNYFLKNPFGNFDEYPNVFPLNFPHRSRKKMPGSSEFFIWILPKVPSWILQETFLGIHPVIYQRIRSELQHNYSTKIFSEDYYENELSVESVSPRILQYQISIA